MIGWLEIILEQENGNKYTSETWKSIHQSFVKDYNDWHIPKVGNSRQIDVIHFGPKIEVDSKSWRTKYVNQLQL